MDVNGLLLHDNKIYFGNDNEEFICSTPEGKILWSNPTSGDVEHEPCLIQANGVNHLIYATESGEVRSVNPANGKTNWTFYVSDFDGWKPGQNRTIFKVGAYVTNTSVFYTKPLLVDLTGDNIPDLIYKSFDGKIYAINSTNGKLIWDILNSAFDRLLVNVGDNRNPIFLFNNYTYNPSDYSYRNKMMFVSKIGKSVDSMNFEKFNWGVGLNTMQLSDGRSVVNFCDSIYVFSTKGKILDRFERKKFTDPSTNEISEESTHHTLLGNKSFTYKGKPNCIVVMHQFSYKTDSNDGFIDIVSLEEKKVIDRLNLKQRSEMPPVITDVNMDGNPDILINCFDGNLYCYSIPTH
jgi:outer membrane protein assembly factor BamB